MLNKMNTNIESTYEKEMPAISPALLPAILRKSVEVFETVDEQLLCLFGALTGCSGLLTEVSGNYMNRTIYPNLFFLASAPAASGKGALMSTRTLLDDIHQSYLKVSVQKQDQYKAALKNAKKDEAALMQRPPFQIPIIPGNVTSSRLIQHMQENLPHVPCIVIESELDTLSQATNKADNGFSDILRKSFHNENISISRKTDNEYYEIGKPKIAMVLSGTPAQINRLIPDAEDGLFSRFMMYSYNPPLEWNDVTPCFFCLNKNDILGSLSKDYTKFFKFYNNRQVSIDLTGEQWVRLNNKYKDILMNVVAADSAEGAVSVIKRNGVILYKIAMVLTAFRMFELGIDDNFLQCEDKDFDTAITLAMISLESSLRVLATLPKSKVTSSNSNKAHLLNGLQKEFARAEWLTVAGENLISVRTADRMLNNWVKEGRLLQIEKGRYRKK